MGRVYLAEDTRLGRKVVLKLLDPELATDERFRERFVRESRLAASIDHPNVIPIYEAGEERGTLFIAMRFVEGTDLGRLIADGGPLEPGRAAAIVTQVAAALDAAHERGLIHRDVKPGNILVGRGDHTYLTDFGLIKRREADTGLTRTGQFMGSVDYAAPEQIRGEAVDARTDVYSLGCVLYECLTGEPPFAHDPEVAVLYAHLNDPPPKVTATRPEVPPAMDAVVAKSMAKSPDDRYPSAGELAGAARDALMGPTVDSGPAPRPPRRRVWLGAAGAALAVAVAVALVVALTGGGRRPAASPSHPTSSTVAPPAHSLVEVDADTGRVVRTIPNVDGTRGLAVGEGGVWALLPAQQQASFLLHLDASTGKRHGMIGNVWGMAVGADGVWALDFSGAEGHGVLTVKRVDAAYGRGDRPDLWFGGQRRADPGRCTPLDRRGRSLGHLRGRHRGAHRSAVECHDGSDRDRPDPRRRGGRRGSGVGQGQLRREGDSDRPGDREGDRDDPGPGEPDRHRGGAGTGVDPGRGGRDDHAHRSGHG
jgi:serine/threonine-protein kinase